ncbi:hypothetical protein E2C01_052203 [Portunus trituberculatus]|uniref:Uncharacterized protein n=1 Tax=Portunus trituberculatus TaxID=210409 RepID=A0A5B7GME2_PORTR|nr:hypothetical protein [Portunus trituberculatus]
MEHKYEYKEFTAMYQKPPCPGDHRVARRDGHYCWRESVRRRCAEVRPTGQQVRGGGPVGDTLTCWCWRVTAAGTPGPAPPYHPPAACSPASPARTTIPAHLPAR